MCHCYRIVTFHIYSSSCFGFHSQFKSQNTIYIHSNFPNIYCAHLWFNVLKFPKLFHVMLLTDNWWRHWSDTAVQSVLLAFFFFLPTRSDQIFRQGERGLTSQTTASNRAYGVNGYCISSIVCDVRSIRVAAAPEHLKHANKTVLIFATWLARVGRAANRRSPLEFHKRKKLLLWDSTNE